MIKIRINANFHTIGGKSVLRSKDPRFLEYRERWASRPQSFAAGEFPLHLDIEASSNCNLRCPFCATNYRSIGNKGFMSFNTFKKVIDEGAKQGLCAIKLNSGNRGEPLLNRLLPEMIAYAKKKGIMDVYFNTNATLLTKDTSKKVIKAGLDRLSISFEGTTPEVYEKYRVGAKFNKVLKNIKDFIKIRNKIKMGKPLVRIQTVAVPEVAAALAEYKRFWSKIADEVIYFDFKDHAKQRDLVCDWTCPSFWQRLSIAWDGSITACHEYPDFCKLGNINRGNSVRSVWQGRALEKLRELQKKGRSHEIEMCNNCAFRAAEIFKLKKGK